jgi:hypothetical protein
MDAQLSPWKPDEDDQRIIADALPMEEVVDINMKLFTSIGDVAPLLNKIMRVVPLSPDETKKLDEYMTTSFDGARCLICGCTIAQELMRRKHIWHHHLYTQHKPSLDSDANLYRCFTHRVSVDNIAELLDHAIKGVCKCQITLQGIRFEVHSATLNAVRCLECDKHYKLYKCALGHYTPHASAHVEYFNADKGVIEYICNRHATVSTTTHVKSNHKTIYGHNMDKATPELIRDRDERRRKLEGELSTDDTLAYYASRISFIESFLSSYRYMLIGET